MNNSAGATLSRALVIFLFIGGVALAQESDDKPTPPYVAVVPDFLQWTITITNKADAQRQATSSADTTVGKPPAIPPYTIVRLVCTKTKDISRNVLFFARGYSLEVWHYKNYTILKKANGEVTIETADPNNLNSVIPGEAVDGFLGVDVVSIGNFQRKQKLENGQAVFFYSGSYTPPPPKASVDGTGKPIAPVATAPVPADAMIAVDTRLPAMVDLGGRTFTYSYQTAPTEMLELPADIQKRLANIEAGQSFLEKMRTAQQH
jgi:hypothetical protein